jgi:preprotein translocase subunit SecE
MARDRQRAKQRQAERRARRLADQGERPAGAARAADPDGQRRSDPADAVLDDPTAAPPTPGVDPDLAVGAPPQDEGRSDVLVAADQAEDEALEEEAVAEIEDAELGLDEEGPGDGAEPAYAPKGRRGGEEAPAKDRPRLVQFLIAVWAELQRVQWPNRQALTTLTGVVLGFVLIAGGYLGLLDAIFSRIIQAIL